MKLHEQPAHRPRHQRVLHLLLALAILPASGCVGAFHPICPPDLEEFCPPPLARCSKDHVHIFFVHGADPLDYSNLNGLRGYCHELGFFNTYYGQTYHGWKFSDEIRRIRAEDPCSRFVLVGFSAGANVVRSMANTLGEQDGINIDLMVYLGGNTLTDCPRSRPANVGKVVNILASGLIWHGAAIDGAENIQYTDCWHFGSASHPQTIRLFGEELCAIAGQIPAIVVEPAEPSAEHLKMPREAKPQPSMSTRDDWDFLKPASYLQEPGGSWIGRPHSSRGTTGVAGR